MYIHPLWYICIASRFSLANFIYIFRNNKLIQKILMVILSSIGFGFLYKYITGSNKEVQIAKVFWHDTRIIHAVFYLLAGYMTFIHKPILSSFVISTDTIFSIIYRLYDHYKN